MAVRPSLLLLPVAALRVLLVVILNRAPGDPVGARLAVPRAYATSVPDGAFQVFTWLMSSNRRDGPRPDAIQSAS